MEGLRADQIARTNALCAAYKQTARTTGSALWEQSERDLARARTTTTTAVLRPALEAYTQGASTLPALLEAFDAGLHSRSLWGVTGLRVRIVLNNLVHTTGRHRDRDRILRWTLTLPGNDAAIIARLRRLCSILTIPKPSTNNSAPTERPAETAWLLLSFCWHTFEPEKWPVFQASTLSALAKAGLWHATGDSLVSYPGFRRTMAQLNALCRRQLPNILPDYLVERVLTVQAPPADNSAGEKTATERAVLSARHDLPGTDLSQGFVPPIISLAEDLAAGRTDHDSLAYLPGTSAERAFEIVVHSAFTIMGYESVLLGQGAGRVPDGYALSRTHNYAVIWDAKIRTDPYRMGTDDRAIREYVAAHAE